MNGLAEALRERIAADGPLRLDAWISACNRHYYAARDPFGTAGDFVTAPEISQMFGEIIGAFMGDLWVRAGSPPVKIVELGPGRGTLMADSRRTTARLGGFAEAASFHLVETSPVLRAAQAQRLEATWHDSFDAIPADGPMIVIANEFFDALPVRQFAGSGLERAVGVRADGQGFAPVLVPGPDRRPGEVCEAAHAIAASIGARLAQQGGAALFIDYGYAETVALDSLQALRHHAASDPFADPGDSDLTTHVDFSALAAAAGLGAAGGIRVSGPVAQGVWLGRLGIEARAAALKARATTAQAAAIEAALVRLTAPAAMGSLFKVMALSSPGWPVPAGFGA